MKAIRYRNYGDTSALKHEDFAIPETGQACGNTILCVI